MRKLDPLALLAFFPVAAILHHRWFYRSSCFLNPDQLPDWSVSNFIYVASVDPSIGFGIAITLALYLMPNARLYMVALFIAFIPLSVWLWDIPGSGRQICYSTHDHKIWLSTWHLYAAGVALFWPTVLALRRRVSWSRNRPVADSQLRDGILAAAVPAHTTPPHVVQAPLK